MSSQQGINWCSSTWYSTFLDSIPAARTAAEIAFLTRQLPRSSFARVLDVCCGPGRHALPLAELGHTVTGVDRDAEVVRCALAAARSAGLRDVGFVQADMRALPLAGSWDAVLNLWASFGYFDGATNEQVLFDLADRLRPGGRFILDVYHRSFFERHTGERDLERAGVRFRERKHVVADRLHVELYYEETGETDRFEWQVWTPSGLSALAERAGLATVLACAGWNEGVAAAPEQPRMQLVFERAG